MTAVPRPQWAMCLGGADCVWDDVEAWEAEYGQPWDGWVIAANDVGAHWPRDLHHWVSLHTDKFAKWRRLREEEHGFPPILGDYWGNDMKGRRPSPPGMQRVQPWPGGSSGMLAAQVAHILGCTRVVLCGIPMTPTAHFDETHERFGVQWAAAGGHWRAWQRHRTLLTSGDWLRSMSGRTQELLGRPTRAWLVAPPSGLTLAGGQAHDGQTGGGPAPRAGGGGAGRARAGGPGGV